jgi:hypothetical protein
MIYFISGHRDITEEDFTKHYEPILWEKLNEKDAKFVVGDCNGVDIMAQHYLKSMVVNDVTVYHMFESPRNNVGYPLKGGFRSDIERDYQMTKDSDDDIAWIAPGRESSGTGQNVQRRKLNNQKLLLDDDMII